MCLPVSLANGHVSYDQSPREYGHYPVLTRASYLCNSWYYLDGPSSSTCTTESVWSNTATCREGNNKAFYLCKNGTVDTI